MDAAPRCRLHGRSSVNISTARGLGQQRKYHERLVRALLGYAHHVGALLEKCARFKDQLGLDGEANSEIAYGGDIGTCRFRESRVTSVGDLPTSSGSALQLILGKTGSEKTATYFTRTQP